MSEINERLFSFCFDILQLLRKGGISMPRLLSKMIMPDPFVMNEDTVNNSVWEFLKLKGFSSPNPLKAN